MLGTEHQGVEASNLHGQQTRGIGQGDVLVADPQARDRHLDVHVEVTHLVRIDHIEAVVGKESGTIKKVVPLNIVVYVKPPEQIAFVLRRKIDTDESFIAAGPQVALGVEDYRSDVLYSQSVIFAIQHYCPRFGVYFPNAPFLGACP